MEGGRGRKVNARNPFLDISYTDHVSDVSQNGEESQNGTRHIEEAVSRRVTSQHVTTWPTGKDGSSTIQHDPAVSSLLHKCDRKGIAIVTSKKIGRLVLL